MANLTETAQWEGGIRRLETTDPIIGGEDGISNIQGKQLGNRTAYLKTRADQVDAAKGSYTSLSDRMTALQAMAESVGPDMQSATVGAAMLALDQASQANAGAAYLKNVLQQEVGGFFTNRGIISGCAVTKSSTATRNLNVASGRCFALGQEWPVTEGENAASVPTNTGPGAISVYAYLYPSGGYSYNLGVSAPDAALPYGVVPIYQITVPAGSTDFTDPYLSAVTISDIRRMEPNYPVLLAAAPQVVLPINMLRNTFYHVSIDVVSFVGAHCDADAVRIVSRAPNGVILQLRSSADNVSVRVRVSKLDN